MEESEIAKMLASAPSWNANLLIVQPSVLVQMQPYRTVHSLNAMLFYLVSIVTCPIAPSLTAH